MAAVNAWIKTYGNLALSIVGLMTLIFTICTHPLWVLDQIVPKPVREFVLERISASARLRFEAAGASTNEQMEEADALLAVSTTIELDSAAHPSSAG